MKFANGQTFNFSIFPVPESTTALIFGSDALAMLVPATPQADRLSSISLTIYVGSESSGK
jgi:hypothetical protein